MAEEIRMNNVFLQALDGKTKRTFAYPCADTLAGGQSYIPSIRNDFVAARGVSNRMVPVDKLNFYNTPAYMVNGESGEQLIELVKKSMNEKGVLIFLFHGVGGEHGLNVGLKEHRQLLNFLKQHEKEIWVAPFIDVMEQIKKSRVH
jgi:hypothetical protein